MSRIKALWTTPRLSGSFQGLSGFLKNRKFGNFKHIRDQLESIDAYSLHRFAAKKYPKRPVLIHLPNYQLIADLLFYDKYGPENLNYKYIVLVIDGFTKFMSAVPIRKKTGAELVRAFKKVYKQRKLKPAPYLQCDKGTGTPKQFNWNKH